MNWSLKHTLVSNNAYAKYNHTLFEMLFMYFAIYISPCLRGVLKVAFNFSYTSTLQINSFVFYERNDDGHKTSILHILHILLHNLLHLHILLHFRE